MPDLHPALLTVIGLGLLMVGGEWVVRGVAVLARRSGLSELLIGLVVVAFGTSSPELVVAIQSVIDGAPDVAVGNVVGSNIANILLVLGVGALITPIPMSQNVVFRDGVVMVASSAFLVYLGYLGEVTQLAGVVLTSSLVLYILYSYATERRKAEPTWTIVQRAKIVERGNGRETMISILLLFLGLAALLFGAKFLIEGAVEIARALKVSEAVIAVSVVAIGTSVPELVAVGFAAMRKHPEIVLGSIAGSNIFNVLAVIGITGLVQDFPMAASFFAFDLWVMLGVVLIFLVFLASDARLSRREGAIMLLGYVAYIALIYRMNGPPPVAV